MQIDDTTLRTVAAKAIVDSLTEEDKKKLLTSAVAGLFEPVSSSYGGDKRTVIQAAFDTALRYAVGRLVDAHSRSRR